MLCLFKVEESSHTCISYRLRGMKKSSTCTCLWANMFVSVKYMENGLRETERQRDRGREYLLNGTYKQSTSSSGHSSSSVTFFVSSMMKTISRHSTCAAGFHIYNSLRTIAKTSRCLCNNTRILTVLCKKTENMHEKNPIMSEFIELVWGWMGESACWVRIKKCSVWLGLKIYANLFQIKSYSLDSKYVKLDHCDPKRHPWYISVLFTANTLQRFTGVNFLHCRQIQPFIWMADNFQLNQELLM